MKNLLKIMLMLMLAVTCARANIGDLSKATYAIDADGIDYLRYLYISNHFQYAYVDYQLGEFLLLSDSSNTQIHFADYLTTQFGVKGSPVQGIDTVISGLAKTRTFTIPQGNNAIEFHRMMAVRHACSQFEGAPDSIQEKPLGGPVDYGHPNNHWRTGKGYVLDDQEFVLKIIDASTQAELYTIDSVGIKRNYDSLLAPRYGTNPDQYFQTVALPPSLQGKTVYIQLVPKRVGDTPYGMNLTMTRYWVNQSIFYEVSPIGEEPMPTEFYDSVYNDYFSKVIAYCDSVILAQGYLDMIYYKYYLVDENLQIFRSRYLEEVTYNGVTYYRQLHWSPLAKLPFMQKPDNDLMSVYPNPTEGKLTVSLDDKVGATGDLKIEIYNELGVRHKTISITELDTEIDFSYLYSGPYILVLRSGEEVVSRSKFIKQ